MKYLLLIHQGDTPTPYDQEAWGRLSDAEQQAVYGAYKTINDTPGVSPGLQLQPPETATTMGLSPASSHQRRTARSTGCSSRSVMREL